MSITSHAEIRQMFFVDKLWGSSTFEPKALCYNPQVMLKNKKVRGVLQVLLSLALLILLLNRVGWQEVVDILTNINWSWYLPAFALFLTNIVIRAYRWFVLLHSLNDRPSFWRLNYLYFVGFFANNFIPSGFGGDVVKVVSLRQQYGRGTEALSSVVMERVTGLLGSSLIALVALAWNAIWHATAVELPMSIWLVIAVISFGIPIGFLILRWFNPLLFLAKRYPKARNLPLYDRFDRLINTIHRYPYPVLLQALLISLPFTISLILVQYIIARALSVDVPLALFPLFVPIIAIMNLMPISFNGLGVREGLYLFLFVPAGVSPEASVAMSLAYYFLRFGAGMVGGLMYALSSIANLLKSPHAKNL